MAIYTSEFRLSLAHVLCVIDCKLQPHQPLCIRADTAASLPPDHRVPAAMRMDRDHRDIVALWGI